MTAHRADAGLMVSGGSDTIVALATPPGRGALAVVRVSGSDAHAVVGRVATPWPLPERTARLCALADPATGAPIDRGIVTLYADDRSYTGEPMVEITTHGGHLVPVTTMAALIRAGAREALPGEFTRRAVLNGKLDLVRAEAVGDLIDARAGLMHQAALAQLDGGLSRRIEQLRHGLIEIEALIAYDIDFPEEDDGPVERGRVLSSCDRLLAQLDALLATAPTGALVREGAIVVLAGPPNAGKSSLYNALLGEARAIVTEIPGTTRDALESTIDAEGWPLRLVDTAGLRDTTDTLERLGIEASERYLQRASVVLACGETAAAIAAATRRVSGVTPAPVLGVRTKADLDALSDQSSGSHIVTKRYHSSPALPTDTRHDLVPHEPQQPRSLAPLTDLVSVCTDILSTVAAQHELQLVAPSDDSSGRPDAQLETNRPNIDTPLAPDHRRAVAVSAVTGQGLAELRSTIVRVLVDHHGAPSAEVPMLTRARHVQALEAARRELAAFRTAWHEDGLPAPVAAVHLRAAVVAVETMIGAVDVEDVLDRVFSTFCVGK